MVASARGPGGADENTRAPDPDASETRGSANADAEAGKDGAEAFRRWLLETELPKSGKSVARSLSSLPLAISEFLAIAGFSALGTVIEQNKGTAWYVQNYPTETPAFGFIDYPLILDLGLDHIYTEWYFLALLAALAASLTACTFTRQLPVWRVSADWKFQNRPAALLKMEEAESLPRARKDDLAERLAARGYQVFVEGEKMYAFKGLIGRLAPIGVHAGLLPSRSAARRTPGSGTRRIGDGPGGHLLRNRPGSATRRAVCARAGGGARQGARERLHHRVPAQRSGEPVLQRPLRAGRRQRQREAA